MQLLRTEYKVISGTPRVYVFTRDSNGKRDIVEDDSLVPYFYVPDENGTYTSFDDKKLRKIETTLPEQVREEREKYPVTYEADILFPIRYLIDKVDKIDPTAPRKLYLDIEVDNAGKLPKAANPTDAIICISVYDSQIDTYSTFVWKNSVTTGKSTSLFDETLHDIYYFRTEEDMLNSFVDFFKESEPDVCTGWNLISFDMQYLLARLTRLQIDINHLSPINSSYVRGMDVVIKGVALVDLYQSYRKMSLNAEESYTLDFIAQKILGKGKTQSGAQMRWLWNNKLSDLVEYNVSDVELCRKIDDKMKILDFLDEIRRASFCQLEDTLTTSRTLDSYVLKLFHNRIVFPTRLKHEEATFKGAFIESWAKGLYENVAVFDLKSLYPSVIVSFNLSPETIDNGDPNYIEINSLKVGMTKKGYLTEVIETLWKNRAYYKDLMETVEMTSNEYKVYDNRQAAIKILLNAMYGQTAYQGSRFHDIRIAETVTMVGREINKWSRNVITKAGYAVLYADTDSAAWQMPSMDVELGISIQKKVNDSYSEFALQYGLKEHHFEIEFQKIYRKAFWGSVKKRYAGHRIWKDGRTTDELEIVGFETRRSDNSQLTRKMQSTVFDMLLRHDNTKDEVMRYVGDIIEKIRQGEYKYSEIGIPKGMSKELDSYENPTVNIRAAKYSERVLGMNLSSKPKMVYVSKLPDNMPSTYDGKPVDAICFDDDNQLPSGIVIDVEVMLDKLIKNKLEAIFDAMGWSMSELNVHWKGKAPKLGLQQPFEMLFNLKDVGYKDKLIKVNGLEID